MITKSLTEDDRCPKCGEALVRTPGVFYWRGTFKPGMICKGCRGLWPIKGEEIAPLKEIAMQQSDVRHEFDSSQTCNYCGIAEEKTKLYDVCPKRVGQPTGPVRSQSPIMKFFECEHLPPKLKAVSEPICSLARFFDENLPDGAEKSAGLRKLLEAKDCLVRASL